VTHISELGRANKKANWVTVSIRRSTLSSIRDHATRLGVAPAELFDLLAAEILPKVELAGSVPVTRESAS
jgi:hypothetical protein